MANATPRLSLREKCDQFIQKEFDEVSNERDSAVRRLNTALAEITKLKNAIANKNNEIDASRVENATLHGTNRQLQQDLNTERQTTRDTIGIGLERATRRDTSPQHNTPTAATKKHRQVIIIDDLSESTSKDDPKDDTITSEDVTAEPETGAHAVETNNAEAHQSAPKKRKRKSKVVVENTSAAKRSRREPKPALQPEAAIVSQGTVGTSRYSVNHLNEIVNEDGEPLSEDIQTAFTSHMDEHSNASTCPRGDWRFASRKGRCVRCQIRGKPSHWTIEGLRQYACKLCVNSDEFCVLRDEELSTYQVLPLPPQFAGEGLLRFETGSGKILSRAPEGKKTWPKV